MKLSFSKATLKLFPLSVIFLILVPLCWLKKVSVSWDFRRVPKLRYLGACWCQRHVSGSVKPGIPGSNRCLILANKQPHSLMTANTLPFFLAVIWPSSVHPEWRKKRTSVSICTVKTQIAQGSVVYFWVLPETKPSDWTPWDGTQLRLANSQPFLLKY